MATLFHQQQQKNNRNNNNNTTSNNNSNSGSGPQGNLTIKKLANGHTMLMGGGSSGGGGITPQTLHTANGQILTTVSDQQIQQNHAPGTTIFLTSDQNGYSLPAKFVLPSTVAAAGGVSGVGGGTILHQSHQQQQHQPQIIQLAPQQLSGVPGAYQIVSAPGHHHPHQQQAQLLGSAKGTTTTTTLTKVPTMMMANGLSNTQPKIISISNNSVIGGVGGAAGGGGTPMLIKGNGHQQQQHQLVSAGGNFLRIVPAGSMNNLVATNNSVSGSLGGLGGGTHQVIQVMGADGRIMTLTGIKKQGLGTTTAAVGGRIGAGVVTQLNQNNNNKTAVTFAALQQTHQQQQQQIVTTAGGQMISAMRPVVGGGVTTVSGASTTTAAGTIILDKAVTTTTANRISTGVGIAAQSTNNNNNLNNHHQQQHPQQSQQQSMVVAANLNTNNQANHSHLRNSTNTFTATTNDLQSNSAINGLKMQQHTTSAPQLNPPPINTTTTTATTQSVPEVPPTSELGDGESAPQPDGTATAEAAAPPAAAATDGDAEGEGDEPEIDIVINNVVCSFSVRCHLNLRDIALNGHNVEFRRENGMVTMKLRKPYTTASMWSSGKITCTGATSEEQAKVAARRYARCLQKLEFKTRLHNFRIVNVLGTCHMPWDIKITNFSERHREDASYEPELHPGVTYKLKTPKATLKIFSTGSVTVTAPSVSIVQEAIEFIFPLLYEFRKERPKEVQRPVQVAAEGVLSSSDEDVYGADSDENVTKEGRLKEDSFWSDEDENGKSVAGRGYLTGGNSVAKKRRFEGKSSGSKAPKVGRFAKNSKPHRRRRPLGKASNDPNEDVMGVSDDDF